MSDLREPAQAQVIPDRKFTFLGNARKEVERRGLFDIPVVDCDCHVYETTAMPEIASFIQNPAVRRPFERYSQFMLAHAFLPGNLGDRMVAGRIKTDLDQVLPQGDFGGMHRIAAGLLNSMNQMAIDYSILFPTPMLTLGTHPQLEVEVELARAYNRWLIEHVLPASLGYVHMNIQPVAEGSLLALFRSRWADSIYESRSTDDGTTWSEPVPTELPNNNSSIQFTALADGRLALVYNHSRAEENTERRLSLYDEIDDAGLAEEQGQLAEPVPGAASSDDGTRRAFWGTPRSPMTLAISEDSGRSWPIRRNLDVGDGYCLSNNSRDGLNREFSYPSIHQGPDGGLNIAYTYFRQTIKYVKVSPEWAYAGTTTPGGGNDA